MICGIDEAGRGPLAGPVVSAAVVFESGMTVQGAADSKSLPESAREKLFDTIMKDCTEFAVGTAENYEIDALNILQATMLSMDRAMKSLSSKPDIYLIDGNYFRLPQGRHSSLNFKTIVKGDASIMEISCASIIAKVTRDRIMRQYHDRFPEYNFASNKGYPTKYHIAAIQKSGLCEIHRKTFCAKFVSQFMLRDE